jgi:hemerythrin HHE cation binding domain-containing protein
MSKSSRSHKSQKSPAEMDAIELLKHDHKEVQKVFKEFEKSKDEMDDAQKGEMVRRCCTELKIHTQLEEEIFYPAAREAIEDEELIDEAEVEHAAAKQLIDELEHMEPGEEMYDARFTVLGEYVNHHIREEEGSDGIFAEVKKAKLDVDELGRKMSQMKQKLMGEMETQTGEHAAA